jgi:release factor glutamine methyltransferase
MKTRKNSGDAQRDVGALLAQATTVLEAATIETARLDSLIILEDAIGIDRAHLLAHLDLVPKPSQLAQFDAYLKQREQHKPLAYIQGRAMFYGRSFIVNEATLIPRPESEAIVELAKGCLYNTQKPEIPSIADVGAGSGCLGLTTALELGSTIVDLYDISSGALTVARKNARNLGVETARFFKADLLEHADHRKYDIMLANLPYVPNDYPINLDAGFEPPLALFAGSDGMQLYRDFWQQLASFRERPRHVVVESFPKQHKLMTRLAANTGYILVKSDGFAQLFALD